jgi:hypothetical protein
VCGEQTTSDVFDHDDSDNEVLIERAILLIVGPEDFAVTRTG